MFFLYTKVTISIVTIVTASLRRAVLTLAIVLHRITALQAHPSGRGHKQTSWAFAQLVSFVYIILPIGLPPPNPPPRGIPPPPGLNPPLGIPPLPSYPPPGNIPCPCRALFPPKRLKRYTTCIIAYELIELYHVSLRCMAEIIRLKLDCCCNKS